MRWIIAVIFSIIMPIGALAQSISPAELVYDPTVDADIIQTFTFFENEIADLEKQLGDLDNALKILSAGQYLWSNSTTLINQLGKTMQQASGLSYAAQDEASQFAALFPGYAVSNNFNQQFQQLTRSSLDTLNNILQTMNVSANDFMDENNRLKMLQGFSENVAGQTQAMQMGVQLASEQISQLQLLRQVIMSQANAQIVYYAQQIQKEASSTAELNSIISQGDTQTTGILNNHPVDQPNYQ